MAYRFPNSNKDFSTVCLSAASLVVPLAEFLTVSMLIA